MNDMIQELLKEQRRYLSAYFDRLDCQKAETILRLLQACQGTVVLSGVGKSGHIAQKLAATFLSTGTKAFFLDPTHAVHGDLGYVTESDVFLALSKSGESQELLELVPFVRKRKSPCIALVSCENSRLAQACDHFIVLPVEHELCPYNIAPTTSTAVQLLFGDCLAIALMKIKKMSLSDFALNHPGGFIGRKISLKVADLMQSADALPLCRPDDRLIHVLPELSGKRCGCLLVVDELQQLKGIFTDGDLRRSLEQMGSAALESALEELMTSNPRWTSPDRLAWEAMRQMEKDPLHPIMVLPVLDDRRIVGLLRMHDILQAGL
jgi:arabinose-5-phosphate isomerase